MKITDVFYKIGKLQTMKFAIKTEGFIIDEYIHCVVVEHLDLDRSGMPEKIKVKQILDLEDYLKTENYSTGRERIFELKDIEPVVNYRTR